MPAPLVLPAPSPPAPTTTQGSTFRHLPYWASIQRLRSEHIFGVCVVTFDTWHLAILFDLVQGIMLASQAKVLSPGNEGSMAVIAYVSIFPQFCFICVHMPISGLLFCIILLVQFYVHAQRPCLGVHRETTGVLKGVVECQRGTSNTLGSPQCGLFGFELLYLGVGYCKGSGSL